MYQHNKNHGFIYGFFSFKHTLYASYTHRCDPIIFIVCFLNFIVHIIFCENEKKLKKNIQFTFIYMICVNFHFVQVRKHGTYGAPKVNIKFNTAKLWHEQNREYDNVNIILHR